MSILDINAAQRRYLTAAFERSDELGRNLLPFLNKMRRVEVLADAKIAEDHLFEHGLHLNKQECMDALQLRLKNLMSGTASFCILNNQSAKRLDMAVTRYDWPIFLGDAVYHYIPSVATDGEIRRGIVEAETGFGLVGIVTHGEPVAKTRRETITSGQLNSWTRNVSHIFVGICDDETYLLWEKERG